MQCQIYRQDRVSGLAPERTPLFKGILQLMLYQYLLGYVIQAIAVKGISATADIFLFMAESMSLRCVDSERDEPPHQ